MNRSEFLKFWSDIAYDNLKNELPKLRELAGKWATSLTTILGVLGIVGISLKPDTLANRPQPIPWLAVTLLSLILVSGIRATWLALMAAQGVPSITTTAPDKFLIYWNEAVQVCKDQLKWSRMLATFALFCLIIYGILALFTRDAEDNYAKFATNEGVFCGAISYDGETGAYGLKLVNGKKLPLTKIASIEKVKSCK